MSRNDLYPLTGAFVHATDMAVCVDFDGDGVPEWLAIDKGLV